MRPKHLAAAVIACVLAASPCAAEVRYGDILAFDRYWGAIFKYDPQTGVKEIVSGYGMGPTPIGDGPLWPVSANAGYLIGWPLVSGPDGMIYTQDLGLIFAVDPRTGDRTAFSIPGLWVGQYGATASCTFAADPEQPGRLWCLVWESRYSGADRQIARSLYMIDVLTGSPVRVSSPLDLAPGKYANQFWVDIRGTLATDGFGRFIYAGRVFPGGQWGTSGIYVHDALTTDALQDINDDQIVMSSPSDFEFHAATRTLYRSGQSYLIAADADADGTYAPFVQVGKFGWPIQGYASLTSSGPDLLGTKENVLYRVDRAQGTQTALPKSPPVGSGLSYPAGGYLAGPDTLLSCGTGQLQWQGLTAASLTVAAADCTAGAAVLQETSSSVFLLDGSVKRFDKASGQMVTLVSPDAGHTIQEAALFNPERVAWLQDGTVWLADLAQSTRQALYVSGGDWTKLWSLQAADDGAVYVCERSGVSFQSVWRIQTDGQREELLRYDPGIVDFECVPDQDRLYFIPFRSWGLYVRDDITGQIDLVSGTASVSFMGADAWAGDGPAWGGPASGLGISLIRILDDHAYVYDQWQQGIFDVDLATGDRTLLSAPEYYPWIQLAGLTTYIPEPATLALLAAGAAALLWRRRRAPA